MAHISDILGDERITPLTAEEIKELAINCVEASDSQIKAYLIDIPQSRWSSEIPEKVIPKNRKRSLKAWLNEKI